MKTNILERADNQIAETNRYLMQFGKEVSDPRAIEMVKKTGQYVKNKGVKVSNYVCPHYDTHQLTKLFAKGVSEEDLTKFYQNPIKDNVDLDTMPENYDESLKRAGYFFNDNDGTIHENLDPYQNINLEKFFELPTEEKVSYLGRLKNFGKKAIPVALAASLMAVPVASAYSTVMNLPGNESNIYDDTLYFLSFGFDPLDLSHCDGFNEITVDSNKLIRNPDEITRMLIDKARYNKKLKDEYYGEIDLSSEEFAWWISTYSKSIDRIEPYLMGLDINGDGRADKLVALYHAAGMTDDRKLCSALRGHYLTTGISGAFVIYPFDVQKDRYKLPKNPKLSDYNILSSEAVKDMLYIEDPSNMRLLPEVTIPADELEHKTPAELGLDKYKPTAAEKRAYEAKQTEKRIEQLVEQGISEEQAEEMVGRWKALTKIKEKQIQKEHKTMAKEDETNPLVYIIPAGLGALGLGYLMKKKSG